MTERTHVAKTADQIALYPMVIQERGFKPRGFWYEVDGDWRRWCIEQGGPISWIEGGFLHRLTLGDERLLLLRDAGDLDVFTEGYAVAGPFGDHNIDWPRVAKDYDGIEIAPYIWSRRLELMWYYGWDCASGCIWQPQGAKVELLEPVAVPA